MAREPLPSILVINSLVTSSMASFKDTESSGPNRINIKESSRMENTMERANTPGARAILTKEAMRMERSKVMGSIRVQMDPCIRDIGRKAKDMQRELRSIRWAGLRKFGLILGSEKTTRQSLDLYCY